MSKNVRGLSVLLGLIGILILVGVPVLAYTYRAVYTVSSNSTTSYPMVGVGVTSNNLWMAANGFMGPTAMDTRVETLGGLYRPHMVSDNKTMTAIAVPTNSQTNLYFTTGSSNLTSMAIIPGWNGYVSTNNTPSLGLSTNGTVTVTTYVNIATDNHTVTKPGEFDILNNSAASTVTAYISRGWFSPSSTNLTQSGVTGWNATQMVDGNIATSGGSFDTVGDWMMINFGAGNEQALIGWKQYSTLGGGPSSFNIQYSSDNSTWYSTYTTIYDGGGAGWVEVDWSAVGKYRYWRSRATAVTDSVYELQVNIAAVAAAAGQVSEEKTIRTSIPFRCTGNVLDFDNSATAYVDCGALYNSAAKLTVNVRFKPDTLPSAQYYLWSKASGIGNYMYIRIIPTGIVQAGKNIGAGATFVSSIGTVNLGQENNMTYSISDVAGIRLRLNGEAVVTNADATAAPNAGTVYIGFDGDAMAGDQGFDGKITNVSTYTSDLTSDQELALVSGIAPAGAIDYYSIDEGSGATIYSYGSSANNGTKGAGAVWATETYTGGSTGRFYEFGMQVNSTIAKVRYLNGASMASTTYNWTWGMGNSVPYWTDIAISVNGTAMLHYAPNAIILGTILPDLIGTKNGDFTWGANPANITVTLGSMTGSAQPMPGVSATSTPTDILPESKPSDWFKEPEVAGALLTNPMRPFVLILTTTTTITETQAWQLLGLLFVLIVFVGTLRMLRGHLGIACIATSAAVIALVVWTIWPWYSIPMAVVGFITGILLERMPQV